MSRRTRSFIPGTNQDRGNGKFKPQCGCRKYHNQQTIVQLRKKLSVEGQRTYEDLVNNKLIDEWAKHVCLSFLKDNHNNAPEQKQGNEEVNNNTEKDNVIEQLLIKQKQEQLKITAIRNIIKNFEGKLWKSLPKTVFNKLCSLALAIGKVLQQDAYEDSLKVAADYKSISILK